MFGLKSEAPLLNRSKAQLYSSWLLGSALRRGVTPTHVAIRIFSYLRLVQRCGLVSWLPMSSRGSILVTVGLCYQYMVSMVRDARLARGTTVARFDQPLYF